MSTAGKHDNSERDPFDAWFDRELAEVKHSLIRLEASLPPGTTTRAPANLTGRRSQRTVRVPGPKADKESASETIAPGAAGTASAHAAPAATPKAATAMPTAEEPWPTGNDLTDPANFGVRPPVADLEQGAATADEFRQRMGRQIAFATKVLHTSRVRAHVWREWRAFEKAAQQRLRAIHPGPSAESE